MSPRSSPATFRNSPDGSSPMPCPLTFTPGTAHSGSPPSPSTLLSKVNSSCYGRFRRYFYTFLRTQDSWLRSFNSSSNSVTISSPHTPTRNSAEWDFLFLFLSLVFTDCWNPRRDKKGGLLAYSGLSKSFTALPRSGSHTLSSSNSSVENGYIGNSSKLLSSTSDNAAYLNPFGSYEEVFLPDTNLLLLYDSWHSSLELQLELQ